MTMIARLNVLFYFLAILASGYTNTSTEGKVISVSALLACGLSMVIISSQGDFGGIWGAMQANTEEEQCLRADARPVI